MANPKPTFDRFEDNAPCTPEVEQHIRERAVAQFYEDCPDFWAGTDDCNAIMLRQYLELLDRPVTRRNLTIAFRELLENGFLEVPFDNQYRSVFVPDARRGAKKILSTLAPARHSPLGPAEIQLISERPERMEEIGGAKLRTFAAERQRLNQLSPIGQPVTSVLKTAYRQSLATEHSKQGLPKRWAEARALVRLHRPELKPESAAFNAEVAKKIAEVA
ncbi:MAG: hypothetical protein WB680_23170 [Candidatus Acidiferrales bacterium]